MSRRTIKIEPPKETLDEMLTKYGENKEEASKIDNIIKDYNKKIKADMASCDLKEYIGTAFKALVTSTANSSFNELQAIEILREKLTPDEFSSIVKVREYIDNDALENAIYLKQLDAAILAPCTTPQPPTITLRVTRLKKGVSK